MQRPFPSQEVKALLIILDDHTPQFFHHVSLTINALEKVGEREGKGEREAISLA